MKLIVCIEFLRADVAEKTLKGLDGLWYLNHYTHTTITKDVYKRFNRKFQKLKSSIFVSDAPFFKGMARRGHLDMFDKVISLGEYYDPVDDTPEQRKEYTDLVLKRALKLVKSGEWDTVWVHPFREMHRKQADTSEYLRNAHRVSQEVVRLIKKLPPECEWVVTADHGIVIYDNEMADGVAGGKRSLCDGTLRVPFITNGSGTVTRNTNHDGFSLGTMAKQNWKKHRCFLKGDADVAKVYEFDKKSFTKIVADEA